MKEIPNLEEWQKQLEQELDQLNPLPMAVVVDSISCEHECTCYMRGECPRVCSHVAAQETKPGQPMFASIQALKMACEMLGCDLLEQSEYKWWGSHVGDYPVPKGMKKEELGHNAKFVIRANAKKMAELKKGRPYGDIYDVGIVEDLNNPGCYIPLYDFYGQANGIDMCVGSPIIKYNKETKQNETTLTPVLKQHYEMCVNALAAKECGDNILFKTLDEIRNDVQLLRRYPALAKNLPAPSPQDKSRWVSIADTEKRIGVR